MIAELLDDDIRLNTPETGLSFTNPFPGLRSFEFQESHLFFGQEQICDQLLNKLHNNKFVSILGGAGVGKTSIINCGIKPALFGGFIPKLGGSWQIFHLQPGTDPILNLARCIAKSKKVEFFEEDQHIREQVCYNILKRGKQGLNEIISQIPCSQDNNYLFIIDQFEDLFRLRQQNDNYSFYEETSQFVDLFTEALKSQTNKVYTLVSIRSDFTDDCIMFPILADLINRSNVVVPKMNREQIREVVLGPLRIFKVQIEETLMARILNDAAISEDVLPRLQHTMHQTWKSWLSQSNWHKPISLKEYESIGGLSNSISSYANSIYESLPENHKQLCENIFKALTERGSENKGLSRPITLTELAFICKTDISEIKEVVNTFRNKDVKLLTFEGNEYKSEITIDIVHVTLIRLWDKLKAWVEDEAISAQMYKQLSETSAAYLVGKAGLLRPPDLNFALNWKEKQQPNLYWAKRYNPAFERTMVFLTTSHETFLAEEELKKLKDRKAQKKVRSFFAVLGGTLIIAVGLVVLSQISKNAAEKQKVLALKQKQEAIAKSEKAEMLSKEALEEKARAQVAANEAEKMRQQAEQENTNLVVINQDYQQKIQQEQLKSAQTEQNYKQVAQEKTEIEKKATIQTTEAQKKAEAALRNQMVAKALEIALKSQQISGNKKIKVALSLYAQQFNANNGGFDIQPDIYNALISSASDIGLPLRTTLKAHNGAVNALVFSARNNSFYSTGFDGKVYAWNINENNPSPKIIGGLKDPNLSMTVSPDGRWLAIGSTNGTIRIIDITNSINSFTLNGHTKEVLSVAFTRDGKQLFSSSNDNKLLLWDLANRKNSIIYSESNIIRSLVMSPDDKFLAGGANDGRILLWDIKSNQLAVLISDNPKPIYSLAFNPTGTTLASGDVNGNIKLWNPYSQKLIKVFKKHNARVSDIKFNAAGDLLVTCSYDGSAYIFDTKYLNNPPLIIKESGVWILSAIISPNNQKIILSTNKNENIISWPINSSAIAKTLCPKAPGTLTSDEWNTYIGSDIKFEKPCE